MLQSAIDLYKNISINKLTNYWKNYSKRII